MVELVQGTGEQGATGKVLVLGGSGHLGVDIVARLLAAGRPVRVLSRQAGNDERVEWMRGDLATGDGVEEAFHGVSQVIHAATNSPIARRGAPRLVDFFNSPTDVDIEGTRRALAVAHRNGVDHFLFVSIVGLEDSKLPYSRVKLAGEHLVRQAPVSWSVVRSTPFFYLIARMFDRMHKWPVWALPEAPFQPVDTRDAADHIVDCLHQSTRGVLPEIGGPETTSYADMARAHMAARHLSKRVFSFGLPERWARQAGIVCTNGAHGVRSWEAWLGEQTPGIQ